MSLYEAVSVSKDKRALLKDLLMGEEVSLKDKILTKGLKKGDMFAARLLPLDRGHAMSGSVYPFRAEDKKAVLDYVNRMFRRYTVSLYFYVQRISKKSDCRLGKGVNRLTRRNPTGVLNAELKRGIPSCK